MTNNPRLLFYIGVLIYFLGFAAVFIVRPLQFLQLIGMLISSYAIIRWLKSPNFSEKFKMEKNEDGLTYFWNKLAIRLWSGMFFLFMLISTMMYLLVVFIG